MNTEKVIIINTESIGKKSALAEIEAVRKKSNTPILVKCDSHDMADMLDCGADDCVTLCCDALEYEARLQSLHRRRNKMRFKNTHIISENITIDIAKASVVIGGEPVALPPSEYRVLMHLVLNKGNLVSKRSVCMRTIQENAWSSDHLINMHIYNLRKKVGKRVKIITVPRQGFLIES